ncbi:MAG TPA: FAD:protein FMN transferase, partial [Acholeplasma sp.]|nr:FAD:protein FMN transferase [Acholeplasma sp.]
MKKIYLVLTSILIALSLIACAQSEKPEDNRERVNILISTMHTYISGHVYVEPDLKDEVISGIEDIFDLYNDLTDNFVQQGDVKGIYYINQQAELSEVEATVEIEKELYDLLQLGLDVMEETNGYFDMTIGKIVQVWKDLIDEIKQDEIVSEERLNQVYQAVDAIVLPEDPIHLFESEGKYFVTLKHGASLDLGAIAKGYAVQRVVEYIESKGIKSYLISGGSSSIVFGKNNPRTANGDYVIELVNPLNPVMFGGYAEYDGQNKSITTSGSYEQYVEDA